ncbi:flotillin family protein [Aestuariispira insulae]|uniref:Putative membrane protein YqiK n=1 Tax=Aestuariispira insulae TaxID=1461337 RepID=A0A3D9HWS6_9PROT|nr:flotillin domain-containing protein [Aestuariispira insulae]RED53958.1 putative membrane protein YqiK [Aestuariispira insulae]
MNYTSNYMSDTTFILIAVAAVVVALVTFGLIWARMYTRASKEISFVRTGLGGQKVVMNGGAVVLPVMHETIPVNMNTLRLEVQRHNQQALITRDRMRVDVLAEFYVRVQPTIESIANAAQTLGKRTMYPDALKELVEGKFVDALRAVAAEMTMEELHEQRVEFVQKVQAAVSEDLLKNGLELESVSLTGLDQTDRDFFNPNNAFDAAGLTKLTDEIEQRRKRRNEIEQDSQVDIDAKNLEAEQRKLEIARDAEYARLSQQREVEVRKAAQASEIAAQQAARKKEAESAQIEAEQEVALAKLIAERKVEEERLGKEQQVREREIVKQRSIESADIEREKTVELNNQEREIAIAERSRAKSEAEAEAAAARALAVKADEQVITTREAEIAERRKQVELIEARQAAEKAAIEVTYRAEAYKQASEDEAEATRIMANAAAEKETIEATARAEAERQLAAAKEATYAAEAAGREALNKADNLLGAEIVNMKVKLALIENLQNIIRESVKPMEQIDGIKIIQVDGLNGGSAAAAATGGEGSGNLADQVVNSALRYRGQAPLIDSLMQEVGLSGGDLDSLVGAIKEGGIKNNGKALPEAD